MHVKSKFMVVNSETAALRSLDRTQITLPIQKYAELMKDIAMAASVCNGIHPCAIPVWEHPLLGQLEHLP